MVENRFTIPFDVGIGLEYYKKFYSLLYFIRLKTKAIYFTLKHKRKHF